MGRVPWAMLTMLMLTVACVKRELPPEPVVLPTVVRPAIVERLELLKPLPASRLVVPLEADVSRYESVLGDVLRENISLSQDDWTPASAPKDPLEVETLIEARLGDPELRMQDNTVLVQVPLTYWGKLRVRARTRFGRIWLTKGANWGTEKNPGRIMLAVQMKATIDEYFRLRTKSKLATLKLKAPRFAKLCTSGGLRVCLSGAQAEKLVHALIERRIRESSVSFLTNLDQRVTQEADLRGAIETAVRVFAQPAGDDRLALRIERLSLAPLQGSGRRVRLEMELQFQARFGSTKSQARPVPRRTALSKQPGFLAFDTDVSFRELSVLLAHAMPDISGGGVQVDRLEVLGAAAESEGLVIFLSSVIGGHTYSLYLVGRPTTEQGYLRFENTRPTPSTAQLLGALELDAGALVRRVEDQARVPLRPFADRKEASLQNRLALLTLAFAAVSLEFVTPEFGAVSYFPTGLSVRVQGEGRASVAE
jgi:hypothetical protein